MLHKSMFKIALMFLLLFGGAIEPTKATNNGILVYVVSNEDDTQSLVIHDLSTGVRRSVVTHVAPRQRNPVPAVISADGQIAYPAFNGDGYDIYVDEDGVLTNLGEGFNPAWSMDGRLAFSSDRDDRRELYVWDGQITTRITNVDIEIESPTYPYVPVWSADGRLAFQTGDPNGAIYVWADGTLTNISPASYIVGNIAWSADGRLAIRNTNGLQIWEDGVLTAVELPEIGRLLGDFVWSADGHLAFKTAKDNYRNESEIYIWDGETFTSVGPAAYAYSPSWSADGRLAFPSRAEGQPEIYVWDNGTITNISQAPTVDLDPVWSADGQIAFSDTGWGVYVWDGETTTRIGDGILPQWMP